MGHLIGVLLMLVVGGLKFLMAILEGFGEALLVLLMVGVFIFLNSKLREKKPSRRRPAPRRGRQQPTAQPAASRPQDIGFEIPSIAGAPAPDGSDQQVYQEAETAEERIEEAQQAADAKSKYQQYLESKKQQEASETADYIRQTGMAEQSRSAVRTVVPLQPADMVNAVIYAEILGRPKAYQRRCRYKNQ